VKAFSVNRKQVDIYAVDVDGLGTTELRRHEAEHLLAQLGSALGFPPMEIRDCGSAYRHKPHFDAPPRTGRTWVYCPGHSQDRT